MNRASHRLDSSTAWRPNPLFDGVSYASSKIRDRSLSPVGATFRQGLYELGWVEGQTLTIEWRWAEGSLERFATLVEEIVHLPVDVM